MDMCMIVFIICQNWEDPKEEGSVSRSLAVHLCPSVGCEEASTSNSAKPKIIPVSVDQKTNVYRVVSLSSEV